MTTVGLVGGLGPESTVDCYRRILDASARAGHSTAPPILIDSLDVQTALRLVEHDRPGFAKYLAGSVARLAGAPLEHCRDVRGRGRATWAPAPGASRHAFHHAGAVLPLGVRAPRPARGGPGRGRTWAGARLSLRQVAPDAAARGFDLASVSATIDRLTPALMVELVAHHGGSNGTGFRCFSQFRVDRGTGLVILTNGSKGGELWTRLVATIGYY